MTKAIQNTISGVNSYREHLFYVFAFLILSLVLTYAGLVHTTVHNILAREALLKVNRNKSGAIGMLEAQYFSLKNSVTLATAVELGFSEPTSAVYISKKAQGVARTTSNEIR
ncbi:MAG: hypothetical protein KBD47_00420 [Candidatus Pacebacteria bacterium]|jgi:hypothetical protein|nr:hypothetical protein [Candidatus Paceibacterota bacterium]